METLTMWQKIANKTYLGSWDLCVGADKNEKPIYKEVVATVKKVAKEEVVDMENIKKNANAKKEELLVYFEEFEKPMIIHAKTNFKGLSNATATPFVEKWVGKKVCVYVEVGVKAFGQLTDALRIKPVPQRICDVCGKVISYELYEASIKKYGKSLCSKECLEKAGIE